VGRVKTQSDLNVYGGNSGSAANRVALCMEGAGASRILVNGPDVGTNGSFKVDLANSTGTIGHTLTYDASGNVGIGTSSPAYITEIAESQAGGVGPTLYLHNTVDNVATGHAADIRFNLRNDEATSRNAIIRAQAAAGYGSDPNLLFLVSAGSTGTPQEAMRIDSSGHAIIPAGVTLGTAVGTYNAANTLDDYEEVNFTATLRGNTTEPATLITVTGFATKIGRVVQYSIGFESVNTTGYAGNLTITGLPFTNNGGRAIGNIVGYIGLTWTGSDCFSVIDVGTTTLQPHSISSNGAWTTATHNAGTGRYFWLSGTYMTTE